MKFISVSQAMKKGSGKVAIRGWVHRARGSNKFKFLVLRDSTDVIQCVLKRENFAPKGVPSMKGELNIGGKTQWKDIDKVLVESSVEIEGVIKEDKRAPTGYEVDVKKINIVGFAEDFPINKDLNEELLGDRRHLWLRSRKMTSILKIRSTVFGAIHEYFRKQGFFEFHSPILQPTQAEGGSTVFEVPYFGKKAFLAQTWQLQAETAIFALEKIYTISPSFRAEKSKTSRHLTEFWMAEMEMAWSNFEDIQDYGEALLKHVMQKVLDNNQEELKILERDVGKLEPTLIKKFPRMTYDEALDILKKKKKMNVTWGKDLRTVEEDKLSELYDTPVIVTDYPKEVKAFYMKETEGNSKTVQGCDFIAPEGYGEIIGGSQREEDIEKIKGNLKKQGENPKDYDFYLDTRRYGSIPHGGFGMGVERIISWICGLDNIKDAIPFPRTMTRFKP
jgi:asparaginyl-tRNA synthetase